MINVFLALDTKTKKSHASKDDSCLPGALRERKQFSCIALAISAAKPPVR
jgi:hypothetical protein